MLSGAEFNDKLLNERNALQKIFDAEWKKIAAKHDLETRTRGFSESLDAAQKKETQDLLASQSMRLAELGKKQAKDEIKFEKDRQQARVKFRAEAKYVQEDAMNTRKAERINMQEEAKMEKEQETKFQEFMNRIKGMKKDKDKDKEF